MDWQNVFKALQFQDQRILDDKACAISAVEANAFISHWQRHLSLKSEASEVQFLAETLLVGRLHRARAEFAMNFNSRADDPFSQVFMKKSAARLRVSVVNHVCSTPTLNSGTSGFNDTASSACVIASRVSTGSTILSIHKRAAP